MNSKNETLNNYEKNKNKSIFWKSLKEYKKKKHPYD